MPVLITGGCGYIGSHVVKQLLAEGEKVIVLDHLAQGHTSAIEHDSLTFGSYGGSSILRRLFKTYDIDTVIHLGASACVPDSVINPRKYYHNNVANTLVLLDNMVEHGVKRMIFSSSAAVYGDIDHPATEDDALTPMNPYGWTKMMIEQVLADYEVAYDLKHISFRYFCAAGAHPDGTIGEHHNPENHLIPNVIRTLLEQQPTFRLYGNEWNTPDGTCIRDFVHVCDIANAHIAGLKALRAGDKSDVYNLGSQRGYSVLEIIRALERLTGLTVPIEYCDARPGDPPKLIADTCKVRDELYTPKYNLDVILETAWKWHSDHPSGYSD